MHKRPYARLILAAAALTTLSATASLHAQADATPAVPAGDIPQLKTQLYGDGVRQDQRDAAAARLLARPGTEARNLLVRSLSEWGTPSIQRAGAKALGDAPTADPDVIVPLFALLSSPPDKATIDSAARALTVFKDNPDVRTRLLDLARRGEYSVRLACISALGTFLDKQVVQTLIELLDPAQTAPVNAAAGQALAYMTGFDAATMDSTSWQKWWSQVQGRTDEQFRADLARTRATRYDQARTDLQNLADEMTRMLSDQYQRAPRDQRAETLLRYLRAGAPSMRAIGARIAADAAAADVTPVAVREQLRQLIGDASPEVRLRAANALALINDPDSLVPLLTQLDQETDSSVRAAIANALRPIRDVRAVPQLVRLLDDPSNETAQAAAQALGERELGQKLRQANPQLAERAADKLRDTINVRTLPMNNQELRNDLVIAMGAMQSRSRENTDLLFMMISKPASESLKVKRSLLQALGELKDDRFSEPIAELIEDPAPEVRLAAIRALGQASQSFAFERKLYRHTDETIEPVAEVREAAWKTLVDLFPKAQVDQLNFLADRFKGDDPRTAVRQLAVLRELRNRARASGNLDQVAQRNHQIGDASTRAKLYEEAIQPYRDALEYAVENRKSTMAESISEGLAVVLLRARQYQPALELIQRRMRADPQSQGILPPKITQEAERLITEDKNYDAARELIKMSLEAREPALPRGAIANLEQLRGEIERRVREQNYKPDPWLQRQQNAMAR